MQQGQSVEQPGSNVRPPAVGPQLLALVVDMLASCRQIEELLEELLLRLA